MIHAGTEAVLNDSFGCPSVRNRTTPSLLYGRENPSGGIPMNRTSTAVLLVAVVAACSEPITSDRLCVTAVNVAGIIYGSSGGPSAYADPATVSADVYATVTRNTGCQDEGGVRNVALAHGESNFLPAGTTLHRITGFEAAERLAVWRPLIGEWNVLLPRP
jgi:hypothetical protein